MAFTHLIPSVSMVELTVEKIKFKGISKILRKCIFRRIENSTQCCTTNIVFFVMKYVFRLRMKKFTFALITFVV